MARENADNALALALEIWEEKDMAREAYNDQVLEIWDLSVKEWKEELEKACTEKHKMSWKKPTKPTFKSRVLIKWSQKPTCSDFLKNAVDVDNNGEDDDSNEDRSREE
uniref:Uncharacterized protein n=1 Tax=Moniliophthora roreri TaxID=221103 RepID=A0A0W0FET4_MONRR